MKNLLKLISATFTGKPGKFDADAPIIWTGDLDDDCTAIWNGLTLRAEWMDKRIWWWAVYKKTGMSVDEIDSANNYYPVKCIGGKKARAGAEQAARRYAKQE